MRSQRHLREVQGKDSAGAFGPAGGPALISVIGTVDAGTNGVAMTPADISGNFSGSPDAYTMYPAVAGLSISGAGVISGTPTTPGTYTVQVTASVVATGAFVNSNAFDITVA